MSDNIKLIKETEIQLSFSYQFAAKSLAMLSYTEISKSLFLCKVADKSATWPSKFLTFSWWEAISSPCFVFSSLRLDISLMFSASLALCSTWFCSNFKFMSILSFLMAESFFLSCWAQLWRSQSCLRNEVSQSLQNFCVCLQFCLCSSNKFFLI